MKKFIYPAIILIVIAGGVHLLYSLYQDNKGKEIEEMDFSQEETENVQNETSQSTQPEGSNQIILDESGPKIMAEIIQEGTGEGAKKGDKITAHYNGYLEDGTKFDSSIDRGQPFSFELGAGQVILGWELGIVGMKVGEIRELIIPSIFAYGEQGAPEMIPPNATLIFEVELLGIN